MAFGERKKYWWWPWSKKIKDSTFNKTTCRRAFEYHNYSWFWRVILGLFTPVLLHRQVLKWINIEYGGYMLYRGNNQNNATTIAADFNTKKLAEKFDLNHYRPITVAFYLEKSRELAGRIEEFVKKAAEDLERAKKILQDQDKIAKDQKEIRKGFSEIRESFSEVRNNQAKLRNRMQGFETNLDELLAVFTQPSDSSPAQNPQQPPRGSLSDVEPECHSQSMSKD